jgi:hypothetical protein
MMIADTSHHHLLNGFFEDEPMTFELRTMSQQDKEAVSRACSDVQRRRLVSRHFFEDHDDLKWAIDTASGNYLMLAPIREARQDGTSLFFFFEDHLFDIFLKIPTEIVEISPEELIKDRTAFKSQITEAFSAHGRYGEPTMDFRLVATFRAGF